MFHQRQVAFIHSFIDALTHLFSKHTPISCWVQCPEGMSHLPDILSTSHQLLEPCLTHRIAISDDLGGFSIVGTIRASRRTSF